MIFYTYTPIGIYPKVWFVYIPRHYTAIFTHMCVLYGKATQQNKAAACIGSTRNSGGSTVAGAESECQMAMW